MEIVQGVLEETKSHIQSFFDQYDASVFGHPLQAHLHADTLVFEAKEDDQVLGGLIAQQSFESLHVAMLAVAEGKRDAGVGRRLLAHLEEVAQKKSIRVITLSTKSYQAQGFYEKQGYREFGRLSDMPFKGVDKIYMVKYLA